MTTPNTTNAERIAALQAEITRLQQEDARPKADVKFATGMAVVLTGNVVNINKDNDSITVELHEDGGLMIIPRQSIVDQYNNPGEKADTWNPMYFQKHEDYENVVNVTPRSSYGHIALTDVSNTTKGWIPFVQALRNAIALNRSERRDN